MRLLSVRIAAEDERVIRSLRKQGVSIADVVRKALRDEAQRMAKVSAGRCGDLLDEMLARFPRPSGTPAASVASTDRRAVRRLIRGKLRGRRR
jgi:hypothetical protein